MALLEPVELTTVVVFAQLVKITDQFVKDPHEDPTLASQQHIAQFIRAPHLLPFSLLRLALDELAVLCRAGAARAEAERDHLRPAEGGGA